MLIVCPNCTTSYEVEGASLGPAGRSVRCKRCTHIWFAANTAALTAIAKAHRADLTAMFGATAGATAGVTAGAAAGRIGQPNDIPDAPDPGVAVRAAADNTFPAEPAAATGAGSGAARVAPTPSLPGFRSGHARRGAGGRHHRCPTACARRAGRRRLARRSRRRGHRDRGGAPRGSRGLALPLPLAAVAMADRHRSAARCSTRR